jgi:hypothetical protein
MDNPDQCPPYYIDQSADDSLQATIRTIDYIPGLSMQTRPTKARWPCLWQRAARALVAGTWMVAKYPVEASFGSESDPKNKDTDPKDTPLEGLRVYDEVAIVGGLVNIVRRALVGVVHADTADEGALAVFVAPRGPPRLRRSRF